MKLPLWPIFGLLSAIFDALVTIFAKKGFLAGPIDNTLATTIRSLIMGLFLVVLSLYLGKTKSITSIPPTTLFYIILSAIVGACSWVFYFVGLDQVATQYVPALDALANLSFVFIFIFTLFVFGGSANLYSVFGVIFITIGSILMFIK